MSSRIDQQGFVNIAADQQKRKEPTMAAHQETLKTMLQDIINGREEQAAVTMHDYFVAKTREVSGLANQSTVEADEVDADAE